MFLANYKSSCFVNVLWNFQRMYEGVDESIRIEQTATVERDHMEQATLSLNVRYSACLLEKCPANKLLSWFILKFFLTPINPLNTRSLQQSWNESLFLTYRKSTKYDRFITQNKRQIKTKQRIQICARFFWDESCSNISKSTDVKY